MRGYILIELMVAAALFALAGSEISMSLIQGIKTQARVRQSFRTYDPFRILFLKMEKDLRNAVELKGYPFEGTGRRIRFTALLSQTDEQAKDARRLYRIEYGIRDKTLVRRSKRLKEDFKEKKIEERVLLRGIESLDFLFACQDQEGRLVFHPFWRSDPYQGIPRAVKIQARPPGLSKTISILQGRWGRISGEEKSGEGK